MGLFSRSSGKRHCGDNHRGSDYYKREGIFGRILRMFGSFSSRRHNKHYSHNSHHSHNHHYSDQRYNKRRYKSSWS